MRKYDYTGKKVYMGIDVHKKTYACVSVCEGAIVKKDSMPACPEILTTYIQNNFSDGEIETAYEAGFSGFHLHRELEKIGVKNRVIHPGSMEVASRNRVKTDKRDAQKLAIQLAAGRLECIYVPTLEQEAKRSVTRLRDNMVKFRQQIGLKIKALLFTQGLIAPNDDAKVSQKWLNEKVEQVRKLNYPTGYYYTIKFYADQWLHFTETLKTIKGSLLEMQTEKERELLAIYESAPGIGTIMALKLKDELGDMSQFSSEKKLSSYLGLTPAEYSSGEHIRQGHISRQGRPVLRHIFVEAAWVAIRIDPQLMEIYKRIAMTRGGKRAIVGVAKRLAGRLRSCIQRGVKYEIKPLKTENSEGVNNKHRVTRDLAVVSCGH